MTQASFRDAELLSAYLDGQLSQTDAARLEARLKTDPGLRSVYEDLRQPRSLLRRLPARRAPHNFTLTPDMAGIRPPLPAAFPIFRLASVCAALLLFFGYAIDLSLPALTSPSATQAALAYGRGGGVAPAAAASSSAAASSAPASAAAPAQLAPLAAATQGIASAQVAATATSSLENASAAPFSTQADAVPLSATPDAKLVHAPVNQAPLEPGVQEIPRSLPVSSAWLFGFFAVAVLSGAGALLVRYRTDAQWRRAQALKPGKISARDLLVLGSVLLILFLLAAAIYWLSTAAF